MNMSDLTKLIDAIVTTGSITRQDVVSWHNAVRLCAFSTYPEAKAQKVAYDAADYQGWYPEENDAEFGAMVRAENLESQIWASVSERLVDAPPYSAAVAEFGRAEVLTRIQSGHDCPDEAIQTLRQRSQDDRDLRHGVAGKVSDLFRLFPEHIGKSENYSESDEGWTGGWATSVRYTGLTPAGELAIAAVKAGAIPAVAMAEAIKTAEAAEAIKAAEAAEAAAIAEAIEAEEKRVWDALKKVSSVAYFTLASAIKDSGLDIPIFDAAKLAVEKELPLREAVAVLVASGKYQPAKEEVRVLRDIFAD